MSTNNFFDEQSAESLVKSTIVGKYFAAWSKVILAVIKRNQGRHKSVSGAEMGYIDLFSGPGIYENGSPSTPLMILKNIINEPEIRSKIRVLFNDANPNFINTLEKNVEALSGIERLEYKPLFYNLPVDTDLVKWFKRLKKLPPSLIFLDPWGYSGLTLDLLDVLLRPWGCDVIFFFNYNRINISLTNPKVQSHMIAFFGELKLIEIQTKVAQMSPEERELFIMDEVFQLLSEFKNSEYYVLRYGFKSKTGARTSHYLIFMTKNYKGYEIMKDIMAKESSDSNQGVASFEFNPLHERQPFLLRESHPLSDLENMLLKTFSGNQLTMGNIYKSHSVGKPYTKKNYQDALKSLEKSGKILTTPSESKRRKNTFSETVLVKFPTTD